MTPQQLLATALRLVALWLALGSVRYLLSIPIALVTADMGDRTAYSYATGIVYFVAATLLWLFPMWTAHKILPRTKFENRLALQPLEAARVGCALLGLWYFTTAIPNLVWFFFRSIVFSTNTSAIQTLDASGRLDMAINLFEVVFALILIVRAADFAALVFRDIPSRERSSAP